MFNKMNATNISLVFQDLSKISTVKIVWYSIFTLESLLILILNSLALFIFSKKSFVKRKSTFLLMNLTFADLLVGLTIPIIFAVDFVKDRNVKIALYLPSLLAAFESLLSLSAMAVERLFAVFWPFKHRLLKPSHYFWCIMLSWFIASVISVFLIEEPLGYHWWPEIDSPALNYFHITLTLFLTVLIVSSYIAIWIKVKFYQRFNTQRSALENKKMAKTLAIVTSIFLITWWPINIFEKFDDVGLVQSLENTMYCLVYSNSFLNCIVYSVRMPEFRKELCVILRKAQRIVCFGPRHTVDVTSDGETLGQDSIELTTIGVKIGSTEISPRVKQLELAAKTIEDKR